MIYYKKAVILVIKRLSGHFGSDKFSVIFKNNGSPSKNLYIKTPLVASFSLRVVIHFSPLAAC